LCRKHNNIKGDLWSWKIGLGLGLENLSSFNITGMHCLSQSLSPLSLADGRVNDILLQIMPDFNKATEALRQPTASQS